MIVGISVQPGQQVEAGDRLFTIEAMKMETAVYAQTDGKVSEIELSLGTRVEPHDLVVQMEAEGQGGKLEGGITFQLNLALSSGS